jgi:hypothetical protein
MSQYTNPDLDPPRQAARVQAFALMKYPHSLDSDV